MTGLACSNCGALGIDSHCKVHVIPCCPGRCPGPGLPFSVNEQQGLLDVERSARAYAEHSHGNLTGEKYRGREEARESLRDALAHLDYVRRPVVAEAIR